MESTSSISVGSIDVGDVVEYVGLVGSIGVSISIDVIGVGDDIEFVGGIGSIGVGVGGTIESIWFC